MAIAFELRILLTPLTGRGAPFVLFFAAVTIPASPRSADGGNGPVPPDGGRVEGAHKGAAVSERAEREVPRVSADS
jgi:hypothetical protein